MPFAASGTTTLKAGNRLPIAENGKAFDLFFDPAQSFAGETFALAKDGHGGTDLRLIPPAGGPAIAWFGPSPPPPTAAGPPDSGTLEASAEPAHPFGLNAASAGL